MRETSEMNRTKQTQQHPSYLLRSYIGYISQFILFILIIAYCILSPSLYSAIGVFFVMLAIEVNVTRRYKLQEKIQNQKIVESQDLMLKPYALERILWIIFTVINFAALIFKIIIVATNTQSKYSQAQQSFYEIQDLLHMFLPTILLPFSIMASLIKPIPKRLYAFRKQISQKIKTPAYFFLGGLCMMVQIWSQSIIGLVYFGISMAIYCIKDSNFNNILYRGIVRTIQLSTIVIVPFSFIASTKIFLNFGISKYFEMIGMDGVYNMNKGLKPPAHFATQILLFLYCCLLHRLFQYQRLNNIATEKIDKYSMSVGEIIEGESITHGEILHQLKFEQNSLENSPRRTLRESLLGRRQPETGQEKEKEKEYELQQLYRANDSDRRISLYQPEILRTWSQHHKKPQSEHKSKRTSESKSLKSRKKEENLKNQSKKVMLQRLWNMFLYTINKTIAFLNSSDFTLRVAEVISIIIIQRYNNVYSFMVLVWLAMIASVQNLKVVYRITGMILLPIEVINYVIMFMYNVPNSPFSGIEHKSIWGFQLMYAYWLDVILFNLFLYYLILFVWAASKQTRSTLYSTSNKVSEPSNFILFLAFIFRYTYLFTIAAMFFLGFSNITCIDLGYVVMFFLFFTFGENLTLYKKSKKKKLSDGSETTQKVYVLTTLSRKFWFIIVYYTLVVIVLKYIYFLFFQDQQQQIMDPIGINEVYNMAFNFSLTSVCKSNTTPFFIIFVLAESQIIIHRSSIYLNYSFSLIASSNERRLRSERGQKMTSKYEMMKVWLQKVICFCLQFYYQGLYYISGIIILACSYSWNIVQVPLVILTCIGLLRKFNRKTLVLIIIFDLVFIFTTYVFRFLNYPAIYHMLGFSLTDVLKKIALFCGFNLSLQQSLYQIIALNVVIVYFAVESYRLCNKLDENMIENDVIRQEVANHDSLQQQQRKHKKNNNRQLHQSEYEPTVIDSQLGDKKFAVNYQQGVIQATKTYYSTDMVKKYKWLKYICKFFSFIIVDAVSIVVLVCCLYFRLSVSMFIFLVVYLVFYYFLFDRIGVYLGQVNYIGRIQSYLQEYKLQEHVLQEKVNPKKIQNSRQKIEELKEFTYGAFHEILDYKYRWKKSLWIYSAIFSVACLVLTYLAQFMISDFFIQYIHWDNIQQVQDILFILGFSVNTKTSFFRQVYFYYLMIVINVVEKLLITFFEREKEQETLNIVVEKEFKEVIKVDNASFLLDQPTITRDFLLEEEIFEKLTDLEDSENNDQDSQNNQDKQQNNFHPLNHPIESDPNSYQKQVISSTNLLIYFNYKSAQLKINMIYGLLAIMVRFYLWLMLINVYERSSFSAFLYLFTLFYFWFRKIEFTVVKDINKAAIVIFLIQYLMLLLDIEQNTSPLPLPNKDNLSLLQKYISDPEWLRFLVVGQNESKTSFIFVSFLINSIIIFVTELYFSGFQYISKLCLKLTEQVWDRYDYIYHTILKTDPNQTLDLNYDSYKSWSFRVLEFAYENFIINSYLIVSILVLLLLSADHTYISLGLLIILFMYIFVARYTKLGNDSKIYYYTRLFFQALRILLFIFITLSVVFGVPIITEYVNQISPSIGLEITISQIFLVLFIQLWLDCAVSKEFQRITCQGLRKIHQKETVKLQCLAYQSNNKFMLSLIDTFKEIMGFQMNIKEAHQIIKEWENTFKVQQLLVKEQTQGITGTDEMQEKPQSQVSPQLKALRSEIKKQQKIKDQENEQKPFSQKFLQFLQRNTNCSLSYSYFQMMKYVVKNNKKILQKILNKEKISIDIWDYILEDYSKLQDQIKKCQQKLKEIGERIIDQEEDFDMDYLKMIIEDEYLPQQNIMKDYSIPLIPVRQQPTANQSNLYKVVTPKKINLIMSHKSEQKSLSKQLWFWGLTHFNYFVLFMLFVYYTINPCLLSLPLIAYIFVYYIIADKKYNNFLFLYVFIIIILGELFQLQFFSASKLTEFFFYLPEGDTYHFAIGYLFFLLVLILIDEEIKRYQGANLMHQSQVESFETACLRMLINEEHNSQTYLWKMYFQDQQDYERNNNPIFYAQDIISSNPQNLTQPPNSFLLDIFYRNKPGIDLYPYIATVQIFLTIYLIFFYPLMTLINQSDLSESLKYFTFSSNMIIALLSHVFVIVAERRITLLGSKNSHKELIKYIFTMVVFLLFLVFVYYWASETPPLEYQPQPALIAFSFFYFIYFFLSGLQVKYGYKKFKKINSFMVKRDTPRYFFMLVFVAIPFLYEIKCIMDWTFLQTSLQLFDWFKLFSIYVSSFKAKIQQQGTLQTNLGDKVDWTGKIIGWIGFTLLLLIIFGPMILFSGLNPTAQQNLVNGGSFQLGIHVVGGNEFTLYSTSHFSNPPLPITETAFNEYGFNQVPQLRTLTAYDLSRQFQNISFETYADDYWGASPPNYNFLKKAFNRSVYQMTHNETVQYEYRMTIDYILNREVSQTTASLTTFQFPAGNESLSLEIVSQLNYSFHTCNSTTTVPGLYNSLIRLITSGTTYKPSPIFYATDDGNQRYLENVTLKMICTQPDAVVEEDTNSIYWEVTLEGTKNGIQMYVFADLYQSLLGGLSFTAIYTSVILVVAGFIRGFLAGDLPLIPYEMNAKPQKILQICQAIGIHRERKQFKEEFLMYYELIDVIRSPEIIRKLGSSYTNLIAKNNRLKKYKQLSKEEKERKKNL